MTKAKASLVAAAVAAALATGPSIGTPLAAQGNDAAIDRAVAAWTKVRTLSGTFEQTVSNSLTGTSATARGTYVQERPNKLAIRFSQPASDQIVSDGKIVWIYLPSSMPGQVTKRSATDKSAAPIDLTGQFLDAPRAKYDISAATAKTVDGHAAHGFNLVPKPGVSTAFTKATVWIDDDDSLIREFEETESSGVTRHIHLTTMELNAAVDRSAFTFTVPSGVKVVDQTKN